MYIYAQDKPVTNSFGQIAVVQFCGFPWRMGQSKSHWTLLDFHLAFTYIVSSIIHVQTNSMNVMTRERKLKNFVRVFALRGKVR